LGTSKPIFLDIGLANHFSGIRLIDLDQIFTNNEGGLAEQFIGQELLSMNVPYLDPTLYYWMREEKNANAEIDYIYGLLLAKEKKYDKAEGYLLQSIEINLEKEYWEGYVDVMKDTQIQRPTVQVIFAD